MITKVKILKEIRTFKKDTVFDFTRNKKPQRIVPIVGLNGCGKTTLLALMSAHLNAEKGMINDEMVDSANYIKITKQGECKTRFYSSEYDKKRGCGTFDYDDKDLDVSYHISAMRMSHGEAIIYGIGKLIEAVRKCKYNTLLLDEPDQSLSISNAYLLSNALKVETVKSDFQVFISVHNSIMMEEFKYVFDLKDNIWKPADQVIDYMKHYYDKTYNHDTVYPKVSVSDMKCPKCNGSLLVQPSTEFLVESSTISCNECDIEITPLDYAKYHKKKNKSKYQCAHCKGRGFLDI
jgi:predicted ATPase